MFSSTPDHKHRFYEKTWGIILLALIVVVIFFAIVIGFQVFHYYRKIKLGEINIQTQGRLTKGQAAPAVKPREELALSIEDDPSFGFQDARWQIVEFADFECSYSKDAAMAIRQLMSQYSDKFYFVFRDFPLSEIHSYARRAAEAANCAQEQSKFWPMHDKIFQNQERLADLDLKLYALQAGLDMVKFNQCFDTGRYKEEVEIDLADGKAAGVYGTPTFFINGVKIEGAIPRETLERIINGQ